MMMQLQRRGYVRAAAAGDCGRRLANTTSHSSAALSSLEESFTEVDRSVPTVLFPSQMLLRSFGAVYPTEFARVNQRVTDLEGYTTVDGSGSSHTGPKLS